MTRGPRWETHPARFFFLVQGKQHAPHLHSSSKPARDAAATAGGQWTGTGASTNLSLTWLLSSRDPQLRLCPWKSAWRGGPQLRTCGVLGAPDRNKFQPAPGPGTMSSRRKAGDSEGRSVGNPDRETSLWVRPEIHLRGRTLSILRERSSGGRARKTHSREKGAGRGFGGGWCRGSGSPSHQLSQRWLWPSSC